MKKFIRMCRNMVVALKHRITYSTPGDFGRYARCSCGWRHTAAASRPELMDSNVLRHLGLDN